MTQLPKAILFDLDGTLLDRDASVSALVQAQYEEFQGLLTSVPRETFVTRVRELDAHGYGEKTEVYRQAGAEWDLPSAVAGRLTEHFWATYHSHCRPFPEVRLVLERLRGQAVRLGIITNGQTRIQEPVVERIGIDHLIDAVLISEREGVRKPAPENFHLGASRLGVAPDEAWYVGDHPVTDIEGAHGAGSTAVWRFTPYFVPPEVPCPVVRDLDELLVLVDPRGWRNVERP